MADTPIRTEWHGAPVPRVTHTMVASARWLAVHHEAVLNARARGASADEIVEMYGISPAEQERIVRAAR